MVLVLPDENSIYGFEKGWKLGVWVKIMKNKKRKSYAYLGLLWILMMMEAAQQRD